MAGKMRGQYQVIYFPTGAGQYSIKDKAVVSTSLTGPHIVYGGNDIGIMRRICRGLNTGKIKVVEPGKLDYIEDFI